VATVSLLDKGTVIEKKSRTRITVGIVRKIMSLDLMRSKKRYFLFFQEKLMKQPSRHEKLPLKSLRAKLFYMFAVTLPSQLQSKDDHKGLGYLPTTDLGNLARKL
jgi:hypothetical protein